MSYVIQCQCGQQMTVEDQHAGQSAVCVSCHGWIQIPPRPSGPASVAQAPYVSVPGAPTTPPAGSYTQASWYKPHRGGLILGLGVTALLILIVGGCCCCGWLGFLSGLITVIMGATDLSQMNKGLMDPSGKSTTQIGLVLGAISMILYVLMLLLGVAFTGLAGGFGSGFSPPGLPGI